jgi:hypothetical protein
MHYIRHHERRDSEDEHLLFYAPVFTRVGGREILRSWARKEGAGVILRGIPTPNQRSAMDDKEGQLDEMGEARDAQYALECVLVRLTEAELQRVIDDLAPRAREHIRVTTAHKIRHLDE